VFRRGRSDVVQWLAIALLAACAAGWALGLCCPAEGIAAASGGAGETGRALVAQADPSAQPGEGDRNSKGPKQAWEERLERVERNRLITVGVFLGIILFILLVWWGWGKVYHRPHKL
jgi:hypothetical protein